MSILTLTQENTMYIKSVLYALIIAKIIYWRKKKCDPDESILIIAS